MFSYHHFPSFITHHLLPGVLLSISRTQFLSSSSIKTVSALVANSRISIICWEPTNSDYLILRVTSWNLISHMGTLASGEMCPSMLQAVFFPLCNVFLNRGSSPLAHGMASRLPRMVCGSLYHLPSWFLRASSSPPLTPRSECTCSLTSLDVTKMLCAFKRWYFCLSYFLCMHCPCLSSLHMKSLPSFRTS